MAAFFLETADNEKEHAKRFFKFLDSGDALEITAMYPAGKFGTTTENLKASAAGENEEWTKLYPGFANIAQEEGFTEVATIFRMISKVEKEHEARYLKLLENLKKNEGFKKAKPTRWKCRNCGYIHEGDTAPQMCPACQHPQAHFEVAEINY